jgi:tetratricopeptide (TPR) repeat protein
MLIKVNHIHRKGVKQLKWLQLVIFLFPLLIYSNTIWNDYALDDAMVITHNQFTQNGFEGLKDIFTTDSFTGFFHDRNVDLPGGRYRPLSIATFAIENAFWGNNPHVSHLINILLFAIIGLILFRLFRLIFQERISPDLFLNIPVLATFIFLAHPIHTEVVANIKGRDEIISLLFSLFALFFTLKYIEKKRVILFLSSFVSFLLALLSKESAITFVLIVPIAIYFFRKVQFLNVVRATIPIFLAAIAYLFIRHLIIGGFFSDDAGVLMNNPFLKANGEQKLATIVFILGMYLKLLFWPHPLTFDYYPNHIALTTFSSIWVIIALIIFVSLFAYACLRFKSKSTVSFSIIFFLISLFPVSNLVLNVGTFMNERFVFQGSVAFVLGIVWFILYLIEHTIISKFIYNQSLKILLFSIIIFSFSIATFSRNFAWKNDYTLFLTDVKTSANSAKSNCGAGGVLLDSALKNDDPVKKKEEITMAIQYLTKSVTIDPTYSDVWRKLGMAQYELNGDIPKAFQYFCTAIKINPGSDETYTKIHYIISKCDTVDTKIEYYRELLKINPRRPDVFAQLGFLFGKEKRDIPTAIKYFEQSLKINPKNKEAYKGLGASCMTIGKYNESLQWFEKALAIDSLDASTYKLLGNAALLMGDKPKADFFISNANRLQKKNTEGK